MDVLPQWIELHNTSMTNTVDLHANTDGNCSSSMDGQLELKTIAPAPGMPEEGINYTLK